MVALNVKPKAKQNMLGKNKTNKKSSAPSLESFQYIFLDLVKMIADGAYNQALKDVTQKYKIDYRDLQIDTFNGKVTFMKALEEKYSMLSKDFGKSEGKKK